MKKMTNQSGFTLLEIIIVIIIVGVLASLALPRFFSTVEYSRSTEALAAIASLRQSMERCYLQNTGTYVGCTMAGLDLEDPGTSPGAHFDYAIDNQTATGYRIVATRDTTVEGGVAGSSITVTQAAAGVTRTGTGSFDAIK